jgi:hypothetical protein
VEHIDVLVQQKSFFFIHNVAVVVGIEHLVGALDDLVSGHANSLNVALQVLQHLFFCIFLVSGLRYIRCGG